MPTFLWQTSNRRGGAPRRGLVGFSLIELVVVLVMLSVLVGMATPSFISSLREERLRSSCRTVISSMRLARSRAISQGHPVRLSFDMDEGRFFVTELLADEEQANVVTMQQQELEVQREWEAVRTHLLREHVLPEEVRFTYVGPGLEDEDDRTTRARDPEYGEDATLEYIEFYPDGTAEPTTIGLANSVDSTMALRVDQITGEPRILTPEQAVELMLSRGL